MREIPPPQHIPRTTVTVSDTKPLRAIPVEPAELSTKVKIERTEEKLVVTIVRGTWKVVVSLLIICGLLVSFPLYSTIDSAMSEWNRWHSFSGFVQFSCAVSFLLFGGYALVAWRLVRYYRLPSILKIENSTVSLTTPDQPVRHREFNLSELAACQMIRLSSGNVKVSIMTKSGANYLFVSNYSADEMQPILDVVNQYVRQDRHYAFEVVTSSPEAPKPVLPVEQIDE